MWPAIPGIGCCASEVIKPWQPLRLPLLSPSSAPCQHPGLISRQLRRPRFAQGHNRGAQSVFPGHCDQSWAPFPAPLSRTRGFQQAGMGEFMCWWPEGSVFPGGTHRDVVCVCSGMERGFPNVPCEAFQPQFSWKRRAEPHCRQHGTCQGVLDTETYLDAPSRAVSLKTNIQTSFLGLGDKNREGSPQSALSRAVSLKTNTQTSFLGLRDRNGEGSPQSALSRALVCRELTLE